MKGVVAIVQARLTGGTRLPGIKKALADIEGESLLERVMDRMRRCQSINKVVVAIPTGEDNDELALYCKAHRWACFRGQEKDVLSRYARAAKKYKATTIVRVTADCPFLDPLVIDTVVRYHFDVGADFTANNLKPSFPHGLDVEVFSAKALYAAYKKASDSFDREHVTEWIKRHQDAPYTLANLEYVRPSETPTQGAVRMAARLTVDYPEDLELVRRICAAHQPQPDTYISTRMILNFLEAHPDALDINAQRAVDHAENLAGHYEAMSEQDVAAEKRRLAIAAKEIRKVVH